MFACLPTEIAALKAIKLLLVLMNINAALLSVIVCGYKFLLFQTFLCLRGNTFFIRMVRGLACNRFGPCVVRIKIQELGGGIR